MSDRKQLFAYISPMAFFIALFALTFLGKIDSYALLRAPEYWVYPAQTILCGALLIWFWRDYAMSAPVRLSLGLAVAVIAFVLWISPQAFFGFAPRTSGFNPDNLAGQQSLYWLTLILRFLRLVVVVPLIEEIFWRGFLLRYLIDEQFERVPIGKFSWLSFSVVSVAFALEHPMADWPAAIVTGVLFNVVVYRTKSLSTCVVTHAVTNLLLGLWIMHTKQWGFW
jgi:uncharacterized protein